MPRLVILSPVVWTFRNIVYSGILSRLSEAGVEVHLLARDVPPDILSASGALASTATLERLIEPSHNANVRGITFLRQIIDEAYVRRNGIDSHSMFKRWYGRSRPSGRPAREGLVDALSSVARSDGVFFPLWGLYERWFRQFYDLAPIRAQLEQIAPDLVWSTVNFQSPEHAYALAARDLGIPVITSILSFDNLSRKGMRHVYDRYHVWCEKMKRQALAYYPTVSESQVIVTGTPQFDYHRNPRFLWSRQDTLKALGLPADARYFLYGGGPPALTPDEPQLIEMLYRRMQADDPLKDYWLVIRHHPLDNARRWAALDGQPHVAISHPWDSHSSDLLWSVPLEDDMGLLVSSIHHALAGLNIASTFALDTAIQDRPAICIRFDHEPDAPQQILYTAYDSVHYKPLVDTGGLWMAHNWTELLDLLRQAIRSPETGAAERAALVAQECGVVDGHAFERVADDVIQYLAQFERREPAGALGR